MAHYKIYVYAICRDEEKFALRWAASMSEADGIFVLDTGSTDRTAELLQSCPKVTVFSKKIEPWRFDTARNLSLSLVPEDADLCVCTDLDEVFRPGWRACAEKALAAGAEQLSYRYIWSFREDGSEGSVFHISKMHGRRGFSWKHPVHEVITPDNERRPKLVFADGIVLEHHPDKEKSRAQYLPLLELSVKEAPEDDRNMHYLGREYMFRGRYDDAVKTLQKHLALPSAVWADERCASMRFIAGCFERMQQDAEAERWYLRACAEAPRLREPWMDLARYFYHKENWYAVIPLIERALSITDIPMTYISEAQNRGAAPYDLLSLAYYFTGNKKSALSNVDKALEYEPENERLRHNRQFFTDGRNTISARLSMENAAI